MIEKTNGVTRELLWQEDFATGSTLILDRNHWNFDIGDGSLVGLVGWGNNEREYYTEDSITIKDHLIIRAERLAQDSGLHCYYGPAEWKSGKIHTAGKVGFMYGHMEIVAKMPQGIGTWPALWMLGNNLLQGIKWPECGEIDILENTGARPNQVQGTIHGPGYFGENGLTKTLEFKSPLSSDFHKYGLSWSPDSISWFFDGECFNTVTKIEVENSGKSWPFDQEFYLILNLAMGGWYAGEIDSKIDEAELAILSIRFYSIDGVGKVIKH